MAKPSKRVSNKKEQKKELDFDLVINRIAEGESLKAILASLGFGFNKFYTIKDSSDQNREKYREAVQSRSHVWGDEIKEICFEKPPVDVMESKQYGSWVSHQKLKAWALTWLIAKQNPRDYGDKQTPLIEAKNVSIDKIDTSKMSDDELKEFLRS